MYHCCMHSGVPLQAWQNKDSVKFKGMLKTPQGITGGPGLFQGVIADIRWLQLLNEIRQSKKQVDCQITGCSIDENHYGY